MQKNLAFFLAFADRVKTANTKKSTYFSTDFTAENVILYQICNIFAIKEFLLLDQQIRPYEDTVIATLFCVKTKFNVHKLHTLQNVLCKH